MRHFAHFALLLLVFCAGLAAGAWFSIGQRADAFAAGVEQRLAENANVAPAKISPSDHAFASEEDLLTAIMSAVSEEEPLLRAHRLHELVGNLRSAELTLLFNRTVRVEDRERRDVLLAALLTRWAAVDPTAAAEAVRPYRERFRTNLGRDWRSPERVVEVAWAQAFPDHALAEAMAAVDAPWARETAWAAMGSLAEGDPARQLDTLARLPANRLRDQMCQNAIKVLAEKDSAAAEARLNLVTEPRLRARLQSEILGKLSERDPAAGLARLADLAPDLKLSAASTQLVTAVIRGAGKKDPAAALAAVDALPEELRTQALGAALVGWAGEHPVDALSWSVANGVKMSDAKAAAFFGEFGGVGWNSLLNTAFDSDRTKTLAWLRTQPVSPERDAMLREGIWSGTTEEKLQIYAELTPKGQSDNAGLMMDAFRSDPSEMEPWVKALPPGSGRRAAIHSFATAQAGKNPEGIDAVANAWPAGPDREAAMRGIVWSLSNNDPRRAVDVARRMRDPALRESSFETVARSWLYRDETAARAWIATTPELSTEQKRFVLREFEER